MAEVAAAQRPHGAFLLYPCLVIATMKVLFSFSEANISPDRHSRRRPFSSWVKRLANLKNSSSDSTSNGGSKRSPTAPPSKSRKDNISKNNPYPSSGRSKTAGPIPNNGNRHLSFHTPPSGRSVSNVSPSQSKLSLPASSDGRPVPTRSTKSAAPTVSTNPDTLNSDTAPSKAGTALTTGGAVSESDFSSPTHSVRSLTTTLTTIQSSAPSNLLGGTQNHTQPSTQTTMSSGGHTHTQNSQFSHPFPPSSPASAIPSHLINQTSGGGHPATYTTATANNLLTDNASIMTLASSSKRRRRNSLDTNASVRALAPSSLFGGSRESLPLSVLSANVSDQPATSLHQARHPSTGLPNTERASVYSSSGIAPALTSERNSYYAGKQSHTGDGGSMRSGLIGHGRNDSITGSIGGIAASSPLASPREVPQAQGKLSRRNSGWGEVNEEDIPSDEETRSVDGKHHD